jgi:hypothetical protein
MIKKIIKFVIVETLSFVIWCFSYIRKKLIEYFKV